MKRLSSLLLLAVLCRVFCAATDIGVCSAPYRDIVFVADAGYDAIFLIDANSSYPCGIPKDICRLPLATAYWPTAVTYDWSVRDVYWSSNLSRIYKYSFSTNTTTNVYADQQNSSFYSGLSIDVNRRKLYISDSARGEIVELNITDQGPNPRIVMSDAGSIPTALAFDIVNSLLYWTDGRRPPAVYVSSAQNGGKTTVINRSNCNVVNPLTMLTVDFAGQTMYFGDTGRTGIFNSDLDGRNCTIPGFEDLYTLKPLAMAVDSTYIYISFTTNGIIKKIKRTTPSKTEYETLNDIFSQPVGLASYIAAEQYLTAPIRTTTTTTTTTAATTVGPTNAPEKHLNMIVVIIVPIVGTLLIVTIIVIIVVVVRRSKSRRRKKPRSAEPNNYHHHARRTDSSRLPPPPLPPMRPNGPATDTPDVDDTAYLQPIADNNGFQYYPVEYPPPDVAGRPTSDRYSYVDPGTSPRVGVPRADTIPPVVGPGVADDSGYDDAATARRKKPSSAGFAVAEPDGYADVGTASRRNPENMAPGYDQGHQVIYDDTA